MKRLFNIIKNLFLPTVHAELRTAMSSNTIKKTVQQQIGSSLSDAPFYGRVGEDDFRLTMHGRAVDRISRQRICGVIRKEAQGCTVEITFKPARTEAVSRICIPLLLILCTVGAFLGISVAGCFKALQALPPFLLRSCFLRCILTAPFKRRRKQRYLF